MHINTGYAIYLFKTRQNFPEEKPGETGPYVCFRNAERRMHIKMADIKGRLQFSSEAFPPPCWQMGHGSTHGMHVLSVQVVVIS